LKRVLKEFVDRPPTIQELNDAKSYIIGQSRIAMENTASQMMWAGESLLSFNRLIDPASVERKLAMVRDDEIREHAEVVFDGNRLVTAAVAPSALESSLREWHESWT
jgi:predicted Zn-dependent peptidase